MKIEHNEKRKRKRETSLKGKQSSSFVASGRRAAGQDHVSPDTTSLLGVSLREKEKNLFNFSYEDRKDER
jgi:hypothetical protein